MKKTILGSALCYLILLLALAALLLTSGSFWALAGLCLLLLLPLASWAVNFYVRRHLQADILTPATAAKHTAVSCRVRIRNGAFLPVMRYGCQVSIRNDLTEEDQTVTLTGSIGAKGESSQTILLQSSFCGRVYVQISRFTLLDYLGLLPMKALVKADARLTILPDLYPMEADMTARPAYADDGTSNRRGEDRSEVYQLREYRPGDPLRQIHWKLSEKLDMPLVREAPPASACQVLLLLETAWVDAASAPLPDAAVTALLSVSQSLAQAGRTHTICWMDAATQTPAEMAVSCTDDFQMLQDLLLRGSRHSSADGIAESFCLRFCSAPHPMSTPCRCWIFAETFCWPCRNPVG